MPAHNHGINRHRRGRGGGARTATVGEALVASRGVANRDFPETGKREGTSPSPTLGRRGSVFERNRGETNCVMLEAVCRSWRAIGCSCEAFCASLDSICFSG